MHYIIYFNQQWVGDHPEEWFRSRGDLARAAVAEMKAAGVLVFGKRCADHTLPAGGLSVMVRHGARSIRS